MEDYPNLPIKSPKEGLQLISASSVTRAQKLLLASLITQSRVFTIQLEKSNENLLILDVTHFLNHRINTKLMAAIGEDLAQQIAPSKPDIILTAPSSGNIPAITTALYIEDKPDVIYAPKGTPVTMTETHQASSRSYTYGKSVSLTVAKDCLPQHARVAICDDFLDTGKTGVDLHTIVGKAAAQTVCFFFVIEKPFGGREELRELGFADSQIISLIKIDSLRPGKLKIAGFDVWFELMRK